MFGMGFGFLFGQFQEFLTYETEFVLFLAVLKNRSRDVKSDVRIINFRSDVIFAPPRKQRMTLVVMRRKMSKTKGMTNDK